MVLRLLLALLVLPAWGCEHYDPPPSAELLPAPEGRYEVGSAVGLAFSEPIDSESLALSAWCTGSRDAEGHFPVDTQDALSHACMPLPTLFPKIHPERLCPIRPVTG